MTENADALPRRGMPDDWKAIVVRMPESLHRMAKAAAAADGLSLAAYVRTALYEYCRP